MSRWRILVVDDEPGMVRAVERVLARDFEVTGTTSSIQAVELLEKLAPHLAILDLRMPEMDGFELMFKIRRHHPEVDIILMTGSVTELDRKMIRAIREKAFYFLQKPFDREVLLALVERCLELRRLSDENRRHTRRIETELAEARRFQRSLLPADAGRIGPFRLAVRYQPSDELCGDLYAWAEGPEGSLALLVADVSGHGASAAMLTGFVKSAFQSSWQDGFEPAAVVRYLASGIHGLPANRFVTLFCGRIEITARRLEYVNAGHPSAILRRPEGAVLLGSTAALVSPVLPLGEIDQSAEAFAPGDMLVLCTDGVTEATGDAGEFGVERLRQEVERGPSAASSLLDSVLERVDDFRGGRPLDDDLTLLAVGRKSRG